MPLKIRDSMVLTLILLAIALAPLPPLASLDSVPVVGDDAEAEPPPIQIPDIPYEVEPPPSVEDLQNNIRVDIPEEPTQDPDGGDEDEGPALSLDTEPVRDAGTAPSEPPRRPPFYHATFASAVSEATDRPVMAYYTWESGCPPCARLAAGIFQDPVVLAEIGECESARIIVNQAGNLPDANSNRLFRSDEDGNTRRRIAVPYLVVYDPKSGGVASFMPGNYVDDAGGFVAELRRARERAAGKSSPWFVME